MQNLVLENGVFSWRVNLDAIGAAMADLIGFPDLGDARYDGPALFIGGGASDYIRPENHAAIRQRFPKADITMMEGAGHWLHAERPDEFAAMIENFA